MRYVMRTVHYAESLLLQIRMRGIFFFSLKTDHFAFLPLFLGIFRLHFNRIWPPYWTNFAMRLAICHVLVREFLRNSWNLTGSTARCNLNKTKLNDMRLDVFSIRKCKLCSNVIFDGQASIRCQWQWANAPLADQHSFSIISYILLQSDVHLNDLQYVIDRTLAKRALVA